MSTQNLCKIGDFQPETPFFMAPLAGITDGPFRQLVREQGAALVCTEMVSAKGLWYGDKKTRCLLRFEEMERPVAYQLFGCEPEVMAHGVKTLDGDENVILDINMGCPVPKVVRNGEGSALMKDPDLAGAVVAAMVGQTTKPITVKFRAGWDADHINAVSFAKTMAQAGAAAIAIHGRTREQYYSGKADWDLIGEVKSAVSIPVIGNGDVFCAADARRMMKVTGCDAVMIARGALGNPWIFRDARMLWEGAEEEEVAALAPDRRDKVKMFLKQLALTRAEKGAVVALREMRKHVGWYFKGEAGVNTLKNRVNQITDWDRLVLEIEQFIADLK